jgi:hypothetical protein
MKHCLLVFSLALLTFGTCGTFRGPSEVNRNVLLVAMKNVILDQRIRNQEQPV